MGHSVCVDFVSPQPGVRELVYDLATGVPALAFLAFLAWRLQPSLRKLRRSSSLVVVTYYAFLWGITMLNVLRVVLQLAKNGSTQHATLWNVLWLLTRFGMIMLEVSVIVFLLQGQAAVGRQALRATLVVSGGIAGADAAVKAVYIFAAHVSLFLLAPADMAWSKWSFWLASSLVGLAAYGALVVLPLTRWRAALPLPAKASFYGYAAWLALLSAVTAAGALLIGCKVVAGYCLYGVGLWAHHSLLPPLVYVCFLHGFFSDESIDVDLLYYSEMRDAGCFDDSFDGGLG